MIRSGGRPLRGAGLQPLSHLFRILFTHVSIASLFSLVLLVCVGGNDVWLPVRVDGVGPLFRMLRRRVDVRNCVQPVV
jgi:hypothetical protein